MRRDFHRAAVVAVLALILSAVPVGTSFAGQLDAAKKAGSVGERPDGYLGLVDQNAGAEAKALVQEINGKRREKYGAIAKKRGTSVEAVAALAGAKLVKGAPPGQYVMTSSGKWIQKPAR
jgi:uncharacterized protein YdbL (DUF1318 family)